MPAIPQVRQSGPKSYPVTASVTGGQVVEGDDEGVKPAGATSARVLGVALDDAVPGGTATEAVAGALDATPAASRVAVASRAEVPVTYAAAAELGDVLVAAAGGKVTPASAEPDARTVIGRCTEPGGVTADAVGKAWINV